MNDYEAMYIVHPEADQDAVSSLNEQVGKWVGDQGGQVVKTDVWGRRKLAYAVRKQTEGTYVVMHFQLPPLQLAELERNLKLNEQVLRYLILRQGD